MQNILIILTYFFTYAEHPDQTHLLFAQRITHSKDLEQFHKNDKIKVLKKKMFFSAEIVVDLSTKKCVYILDKYCMKICVKNLFLLFNIKEIEKVF